MSLTNDYWTKQVSEQNLRELRARADEARLAKELTAGQPKLWQRVWNRITKSQINQQQTRSLKASHVAR